MSYHTTLVDFWQRVDLDEMSPGFLHALTQEIAMTAAGPTKADCEAKFDTVMENFGGMSAS